MINPNSILNDWLSLKKNELIKSYNDNGFRASGKFEKSLRIETDVKGGRMFGIYYAYWLENGRNKNRKQDNKSLWSFARWAANTFIGEWCRNKGINEELALPIAYKIAKEGFNYIGARQNFISKVFNSESLSELNLRLKHSIIKDLNSEIMTSFAIFKKK